MPLYKVTHVGSGDTLQIRAVDEHEAIYKATIYWDVPWVDSLQVLTAEVLPGNWPFDHLPLVFWGIILSVLLSCLAILVLLGPERLAQILGR